LSSPGSCRLKLDCPTDIGDPTSGLSKKADWAPENLALASLWDQKPFVFAIFDIGRDAAITRMLEMDGWI
jgi:hypothetical protein